MWNKNLPALLNTRFRLCLVAVIGVAATMAGQDAASASISAMIEERTVSNTTALHPYPIGGINDPSANYIFTPGFSVTKTLDSAQYDNDQSQLFVKLPDRQKITLRSESGRSTISAYAQFTYFGGRLDMQSVPIGIEKLGQCTNTGKTGRFNLIENEFMWQVNGPGGCVARHLSNPPISQTVSIRDMTVALRLSFLDLHRMEPGVYTATVPYTVGHKKDFDFGTGADTGGVNAFDLDIQVVVAGDLRLSLDKSSLTLEPDSGWDRYMGSGKLPDSLSESARFDASGSSKFSVYLECEKRDGQGNCQITHRDRKDEVPVIVTLIAEGARRPFQLLALGKNRRPVISARLAHKGTLEFRVDADGVKKMANHRGVPYTGRITLIFDAE